MGIVRAFDPDTGASGGPAPAAASGADLSALGFTSVNLTDGWTLAADPDSLVQSVSYSGDTNTIVMNALASGSNNHAWGNSSTQRGPRWTKALTVQDASGSDVRITTGDYFVFQTVMEYIAPSNRFAASSVMCATPDGTSLSSSDNKLIGGIGRYQLSGGTAQQHGAMGGSIASVQSSTNNHRTTTVAHVRGQRMEAITYITTTTSGSVQAHGRDHPADTYVNGTTDMNLMLGVGTFSTGGIVSGDDVKVKAWFRCIKMSLP